MPKEGSDSLDMQLNWSNNFDKSFKNLDKRIDNLSSSQNNLYRSTDNVNDEFSRFNNVSNKLHQTTSTTNKLLGGLNQRMTSLYAASKGFLGAWLGWSVLRDAWAQTAELNEQFTILSVQLDGTTRLMGRLTEEAKLLERQFGYTIEESAQFVQSVAQYPILAKNIEGLASAMVGFHRATGVSVDAVASFQNTLSVTAKQSTSDLNLYLAEIQRIKRVTGLTSQETEGLVGGIEQVVSQYGLLTDNRLLIKNTAYETAKMAGVFKKVGISADKAANMVDSLMNPDSLEDNMLLYAEMGLSMQEISDLMTGKADITDYTDRLAGVAEKYTGMGLSGVVAMQDVFRASGLTSQEVMALGNRGRDALEEIEQGALDAGTSIDEQLTASNQQMAQTIEATTEGELTQIGKVKAKFNEFARELVDIFVRSGLQDAALDAFNSIGDALLGLVRSLGVLEEKTHIFSGIGRGIGEIFKVIGRIIEDISNRFGGVVGQMGEAQNIGDRIHEGFKTFADWIFIAYEKLMEFAGVFGKLKDWIIGDDGQWKKRLALVVGIIVAGFIVLRHIIPALFMSIGTKSGIQFARGMFSSISKETKNIGAEVGQDIARGMNQKLSSSVGERAGDNISDGMHRGMIDGVERTTDKIEDEFRDSARNISRDLSRATNTRTRNVPSSMTSRDQRLLIRADMSPARRELATYAELMRQTGSEHSGILQGVYNLTGRLYDYSANKYVPSILGGTKAYEEQRHIIENINGAGDKKITSLIEEGSKLDQNLSTLREQRNQMESMDDDLGQRLRMLEDISREHRNSTLESDKQEATLKAQQMGFKNIREMNREISSIQSRRGIQERSITEQLDKQEKEYDDILAQQRKISRLINPATLQQRKASLVEEYDELKKQSDELTRIQRLAQRRVQTEQELIRLMDSEEEIDHERMRTLQAQIEIMDKQAKAAGYDLRNKDQIKNLENSTRRIQQQQLEISDQKLSIETLERETLQNQRIQIEKLIDGERQHQTVADKILGTKGAELRLTKQIGQTLKAASSHQIFQGAVDDAEKLQIVLSKTDEELQEMMRHARDAGEIRQIKEMMNLRQAYYSHATREERKLNMMSKLGLEGQEASIKNLSRAVIKLGTNWTKALPGRALTSVRTKLNQVKASVKAFGGGLKGATKSIGSMLNPLTAASRIFSRMRRDSAAVEENAQGTRFPRARQATSTIGRGIRRVGSGLLAGGVIGSLMMLMNRLVPDLQSITEPLFTALEPLGTVFSDVLSSLVTTLAPVLSDLMTTLGPTLMEVGQILGEVFKQIGPLLGELLGTLGRIFGDLFTNLAPAFKSIMENLIPVLTNIMGTIGPIISDLVNMLVESGIFDLFGELLGLLEPIGRIIGVFFNLLKPILPVLTRVLQFLIKIIEKEVGWLTGWYILLVDGLSDTSEKLEDIPQMLEQNREQMGNIFNRNDLVDKLRGLEEGELIPEDLLQEIAEVDSQLVEQYRAGNITMDQLIGSLDQNTEAQRAEFLKNMKEQIEEIGEAFSDAGNNVAEGANYFTQSIAASLGNVDAIDEIRSERGAEGLLDFQTGIAQITSGLVDANELIGQYAAMGQSTTGAEAQRDILLNELAAGIDEVGDDDILGVQFDALAEEIRDGAQIDYETWKEDFTAALGAGLMSEAGMSEEQVLALKETGKLEEQLAPILDMLRTLSDTSSSNIEEQARIQEEIARNNFETNQQVQQTSEDVSEIAQNSDNNLQNIENQTTGSTQDQQQYNREWSVVEVEGVGEVAHTTDFFEEDITDPMVEQQQITNDQLSELNNNTGSTAEEMSNFQTAIELLPEEMRNLVDQKENEEIRIGNTDEIFNKFDTSQFVGGPLTTALRNSLDEQATSIETAMDIFNRVSRLTDENISSGEAQLQSQLLLEEYLSNLIGGMAAGEIREGEVEEALSMIEVPFRESMTSALGSIEGVSGEKLELLMNEVAEGSIGLKELIDNRDLLAARIGISEEQISDDSIRKIEGIMSSYYSVFENQATTASNISRAAEKIRNEEEVDIKTLMDEIFQTQFYVNRENNVLYRGFDNVIDSQEDFLDNFSDNFEEYLDEMEEITGDSFGSLSDFLSGIESGLRSIFGQALQQNEELFGNNIEATEQLEREIESIENELGRFSSENENLQNVIRESYTEEEIESAREDPASLVQDMMGDIMNIFNSNINTLEEKNNISRNERDTMQQEMSGFTGSLSASINRLSDNITTLYTTGEITQEEAIAMFTQGTTELRSGLSDSIENMLDAISGDYSRDRDVQSLIERIRSATDIETKTEAMQALVEELETGRESDWDEAAQTMLGTLKDSISMMNEETTDAFEGRISQSITNAILSGISEQSDYRSSSVNLIENLRSAGLIRQDSEVGYDEGADTVSRQLAEDNEELINQILGDFRPESIENINEIGSFARILDSIDLEAATEQGMDIEGLVMNLVGKLGVSLWENPQTTTSIVEWLNNQPAFQGGGYTGNYEGFARLHADEAIIPHWSEFIKSIFTAQETSTQNEDTPTAVQIEDDENNIIERSKQIAENIVINVDPQTQDNNTQVESNEQANQELKEIKDQIKILIKASNRDNDFRNVLMLLGRIASASESTERNTDRTATGQNRANREISPLERVFSGF